MVTNETNISDVAIKKSGHTCVPKHFGAQAQGFPLLASLMDLICSFDPKCFAYL